MFGAAFLSLFNLSLMVQEQTLNILLEKYEGEEAISEIELLLEAGINAQNKNGNAALIIVSDYEILKLLSL